MEATRAYSTIALKSLDDERREFAAALQGALADARSGIRI